MDQGQFVEFSGRTDFGSPDRAYDRLKMVAKSHGSFVDLTHSSPRSAGISLPHPVEWFEGVPADYEPSPRGLPSAREALAGAYSARASVQSDSFVLTASTSEAYSFALHVLCDPGDRILVPSPSYPLFEQLSQLSGVELVRYRVAYDGAFHIDLGSLPSKEQANADSIRAIFCVSPNNPTGNSLRPEELDRLRSLALPLLVDEVFLPYAARGPCADPLAGAETTDLTIVVDGLSKRAASPGLKLGWLLALGRRAEGFLERVEWVSDAYLSPGSLVQHALPKILEDESNLQSRIQSRLEAARRSLADAELGQVGVSELRTEGGWTALLRLPATLSEEDWWKVISEAGLWVQPGRLYGISPGPVFALSLLTPPEDLAVALRRLRGVVRSHQ